MLRSAISYVMQSGLVVGASNNAGKLVIVVHGAQLDDTHSQFVPVMASAAVPVMENDDVPVKD